MTDRLSLAHEMLERAIKIAVYAHAGQVDKSGEPYILHPLRVMQAFPGEPVLQTVAVLHDVAEDCEDWPLNAIEARGFPKDVMQALGALTRQEGEAYSVYIERAGKNWMAWRVKLADLDDNLSPRRSAGLSDSLRKRYVEAVRVLIEKEGKE